MCNPNISIDKTNAINAGRARGTTTSLKTFALLLILMSGIPMYRMNTWFELFLEEVSVTSTFFAATNLPFAFLDRPHAMTDAALGMSRSNLPYIATIREYPTGAEPETDLESPNFYDMLLAFDCLPSGEECFKCLKSEDRSTGGNCQVCQAQCPCYCQSLCEVRPSPKPLVAEWKVTRPSVAKDPKRLVPRIIHQTWFEPITKEKYPNMSRLIESFRQSGWQYEFYDDDRAVQFLQAHFPPAVMEAYDALLPGAYKADLFRYCVLLIMGGLYADMDIMLESNLDRLIPPSVGFMVPEDLPGKPLDHGHCLWNGFLAAAPGHPFMAQAIQNVMNNARNRYNAMDYDDMLCPDPVLAVPHLWDTLFTAGPCILGISINDVLQLHRQTGFKAGDIDVFTDPHKATNDEAVHERTRTITANDPRFLIPGRSIILKQGKDDMGSHRFTWEEMNMVAAATDMPNYDDRPKTLVHYSETHEDFGVFGLERVYKDTHRANEDIAITVVSERR